MGKRKKKNLVWFENVIRKNNLQWMISKRWTLRKHSCLKWSIMKMQARLTWGRYYIATRVITIEKWNSCRRQQFEEVPTLSWLYSPSIWPCAFFYQHVCVNIWIEEISHVCALDSFGTLKIVVNIRKNWQRSYSRWICR